MEATRTTDHSADAVWQALANRIWQDGGEIHPSLELREQSPGHRGVFCTQPIGVGETLIRLPSHLAVDGRHFPRTYDSHAADNAAVGDSTSKQLPRAASPWLRCLAAYYQASRRSEAKPYLQSLPETYETAAAWKTDEIDSFLAGTSTVGGSSIGWQADRALVEERYHGQIRPYLVACQLLEGTDPSDLSAELEEFQRASQCLSTRGFHLEKKEEDATFNDYTGPFLLPAVDLLNHAVGDKKCTTLQRDVEGNFSMQTERSITAGEEVLHSYGDSLTACQCFQTFGFVPEAAMSNVLQCHPSDPITPALLTKVSVLEACWQVIESDLPGRLGQIMQERNMEDEVWTVSVDRRRTADFISDDILIVYQHPLSNEVVTTACLPFLPICAYREASQGLLGREILEDFFLGNLVCTSLLRAIKAKLDTYTPVYWHGARVDDDAVLLRDLLASADGSDATTHQQGKHKRRLMYGLTLRLEEKACLRALQEEVRQTLHQMLSEEDYQGLSSELEQVSKKQRL
jgi:hypothetical protein